MLTAIKTVHGKNGPWLSNGGYEYNVVLIAAALALVEVGPGPLSLDAARGRERSGSAWTLAALLAGGVGALGAHLAAAAAPAAPAQAPSDAFSEPAPETNSQAAPTDAGTVEQQA
jgi:putative oxidoreductase